MCFKDLLPDCSGAGGLRGVAHLASSVHKGSVASESDQHFSQTCQFDRLGKGCSLRQDKVHNQNVNTSSILSLRQASRIT